MGTTEDLKHLFQQPDVDYIAKKVDALLESAPIPGQLDEHGNTATHLAAAYSSLPVLLHFLEKHGADEVNYYGQTLLMSACMDTKLEKVRHLVDNCVCDVHQTDYCGNTALHVAASLSSIPVIEYLLSKGIDLNKENDEGLTLLLRISNKRQWTQMNGHQKRGFEVAKAFTKNVSPIHLACANNELDVCKWLLPKVELPAHGYSSLLLHSCRDINGLDKIKYFHTQGADINYLLDDFTPLSLACEHSDVDSVKYLLGVGANILWCSSEDRTLLLHRAAFSADLEKYILLHNKLKEIYQVIPENRCKLTHLEIAATCASLVFLKWCHEQGYDMNAMAEDNTNLLHLAVRDKCIDKAAYVLNNLPKDSINAKTNRGETPLHFATRWSSLDMVKFLIANGADVNATDESGGTILIWAALGTSTDTLEYLLSLGMDINQSDNTQQTPLIKAGWISNVGMIQCILRNGANLQLYKEHVLFVTAFGKNVSNLYFLAQVYGEESHDLIINVNNLNSMGQPAYFGCIYSGFMPMLQAVKQLGADFCLQDNDGNTPLHIACKNMSLPVVQFLFNNGNSLEVKNKEDIFPLQLAAMHSSLDIMKYLLQMSIRRNAQVADLCLLHTAAQGTNRDKLLFLLEQGFNINARNSEGKSPIHLAAWKGSIDVLQCIIDHGVSVNDIDNSGQCPLGLSCLSAADEIEKVKLLIKHGALINLKDNEGATPLNKAVRATKSVELIRYLLSCGADFTHKDHRGLSMLHSAACGKSKDILEILMDTGLSISEKDNEGNTLMHFACAFGSDEIIKYMLKMSPNMDVKGTEGQTPLHFLHMNNISAIQVCAQEDVDFSVMSDKGETPLHVAASKGKLEHVKCFIERASIDIHIKTMAGSSVLHSACEGNNIQLLDYLLKDIDINTRNNSQETALHFAAKKGTTEVVDYLLSRGADITATDTGKYTSLHFAVYNGNQDVVKLLISKGADINAVSNNGQTLLHVVAVTSHIELASYIMSLNIGKELLDTNGATAFLHAAGYGSEEMVKFFIDCKVDILAKSVGGMTALHMAAKENKSIILELLLTTSKFNLEAKDTNGKSALFYAVYSKQKDKVDVLIKYGSDVNHQDNNGRTALVGVCSQSDDLVDVLEILHKAGAVLDIVYHSRIPLQSALYNNLEKCSQYLVENGNNINYSSGKNGGPMQVAFRRSSAYFVKVLLAAGADIHQENSLGNPAFGYCREEIEKEFLLLHVLNSSLPLAKFLQSIKLWEAKRYHSALAWFSFAGGNIDFLNIENLSHISSNQIKVILVSNPVFLYNHKEAILLEVSLKSEQLSGLSEIMEEKMRTIPLLKEFCRKVIRQNIVTTGSVFPKAKTFIKQVLLTGSAFKYLFLIDEMALIEPDATKELIKMLKLYEKDSTSVGTSSTLESIPGPDPLPKPKSSFPEERFLNATDDSESILLNDVMEWCEKRDHPRWILDQVAGTCIDGLYTNVTDLNASESSKSFVNGYLRLCSTFLSLLKNRDGSVITCKGYGSLFTGTQVMELDEMDFLAIQSENIHQITETEGPGFVFKVHKALSTQHYLVGTQKQYISQALQRYLKNETRPENPSTGQVYVQSCLPGPIAPAVCTVFAWKCISGHRHHLSVDLTPAILWKNKKLGDIHNFPPVFSRQPFCTARNELERLEPILVPCPINHVDIEEDHLISSWVLSFCNTSEIMWRVLDEISPNIRLLLKQTKVLRNHILPYKLKYVSGTAPDKGSWQGGSVVSSWVLYNILLEQVVRNPQCSCWTDDKFEQRFREFLDDLKCWSYREFFTGKEEESTRWSNTENVMRQTLLNEMTTDIKHIMTLISQPLAYSEPLDEIITALHELNKKEKVFVVVHSQLSESCSEEERQPYEDETSLVPEPLWLRLKRLMKNKLYPPYQQTPKEDKVGKFVLSFISVSMGRLRFDTESVMKTLGITTHTVCYYKCPQIQKEWLSDPLYCALLVTMHGKIKNAKPFIEK